MSWIRPGGLDEVKANAVALAKAAQALGIPLVLTSSLEDQAHGPLMKELHDIAPDAYTNRVRRRGVVNALDDPNYQAAVSHTGRHNFIVAGVTNDVCTVFRQIPARARSSRSLLSDQIRRPALQLARESDAGRRRSDLVPTSSNCSCLGRWRNTGLPARAG